MENSNSTHHDDFLHYIDLAIETGDSKYIDFAIKNYGHIGISYINWANQIKQSLLLESFEEMSF